MLHVIGKRIQINEYIDLQMEDHKAIIYVAGNRFIQCSFLVADLSKKQAEEIDSIDKLALIRDAHSLEGMKEQQILSDDEILMGHASNLIAWCENGYDTRILHSNLSFPLLKAIAREGDAKAKRVLQGEIIDRLRADFPPTSITILATCSDVMDEEAFFIIAKSSNPEVRLQVAMNDQTPNKVRESMIDDEYPLVVEQIGSWSTSLKGHIIYGSREMIIAVNKARSRGQDLAREPLTPEVIKGLRHEKNYTRVTLASHLGSWPDTPLAVFVTLSRDPNPYVRRMIAANYQTPKSVLEYLSNDKSDLVREFLAENEETPLHVLKKLAKDESSMVRGEVATNPHAPISLLKELARDMNTYVRKLAVDALEREGDED